jgi:uncharacterized protein
LRFWDSSALFPLFIEERTSTSMRELVALDDEVVVWTLTVIELLSGIWRRDPAVHDVTRRAAAARLVTRADVEWSKVADTRSVIAIAKEVAKSRRLRAGDTLQLSAALVASEGNPARLPFVTLDRDLASAARAEGFPVLP